MRRNRTIRHGEGKSYFGVDSTCIRPQGFSNVKMSERRRSYRRDLRMRVHLFRYDGKVHEYAHLHDINQSGVYLMTRQRLSLNEKVDLVIPARVKKDMIRICVRVVRRGSHRSWGLYSYGCRILYSG